MPHTSPYRRRSRGAFLLVAEPARYPAARPRLLMLALLLASLGLAVAAGQPRSAPAAPASVPTSAFSPPADVAAPPIMRKLVRGDVSRPEVALTFDDGPNPATTRLLLALLRMYRARATFFLIGDSVRQRPELVRAMVADGHAIGNHTARHARLLPLETEQVREEIAGCDAALRRCGVVTRLFRPPGGRYDDRILDVVNAAGLTLVQWTVNPGDYTRPGADVIADRVLDQTTNGSIVLLHDGCEQTLTALPRILHTLAERGYRCVTVDEMLERAGGGADRGW